MSLQHHKLYNPRSGVLRFSVARRGWITPFFSAKVEAIYKPLRFACQHQAHWIIIVVVHIVSSSIWIRAIRSWLHRMPMSLPFFQTCQD